MDLVFSLLLVQVTLGGLDNFWHHELVARLPQRPSARYELVLHAAREGIYGLLLLGIAWTEWRGAWVLLPAALMLAEVAITCADFVEEDRTRRLPPFEAVLHTLLAVNYGALVALLGGVFARGWSLPAEWHFVSHGVASWFFTAAGIGVLAWSLRNAVAVMQLGAVDPAEATWPAERPGPAVLVTGATGFIGRTVVRQLRSEGQRVIVLSRDLLQARALFPGVQVVDRLDDIAPETRIDAIVHLAGATVLGLPWTRGRRRVLLDSRTALTRDLLALCGRLQERPRVLVAASAVGFYGVSAAGRPLDERAAPQPGRFQSNLCVAVEHEARRAEALRMRVACLRFGIVLGHGGGAYPGLALAARLGLGAVLGTGAQPLPWIHVEDAASLVRFAIANDALAGPVNAVAPELPVQADFTRALAASFGRRARLRVPGAVLRTALGEMSELLLHGQNAVPRAALAAGFRFRWGTVGSALGDLAEHDRVAPAAGPFTPRRVPR